MQTVYLGETEIATFDYVILKMGINEPCIILIKEKISNLLDNIETLKLYKLECKNGIIVETKIK